MTPLLWLAVWIVVGFCAAAVVVWFVYWWQFATRLGHAAAHAGHIIARRTRNP